MMLVTGGAGFIGTAVVRALLRNGHAVRVVDDLSKRQVIDLPPGCDFMNGDISDRDVCRRAFAGVDTCFHLAAKIGGIGYFHRYPAAILDDNNLMLSCVFREAAEVDAKVVYVSSSMVFERATEFPTPEDALDRSPPPFSAYGFSKLVGEWYCRAFHQQFGVRFAIARPFNAYGPGELPENEPGLAHVIPDLIKKILDRQYPIEILGDGSQTRSFTYVDDVADAITMIGTRPQAEGQDYNIGTGEETSIRQTLGILWHIIGNSGEPEVITRAPLSVDVHRRIPDVTRIRRALGWTANASLEEGLERTLDWHMHKRQTASSG